MAIKASIVAIVPFAFPIGIVNDSFPAPPSVSPDLPGQTGADIPSIYANSDINFNITFIYEETVGQGEESIVVTAPVIKVELMGDLPIAGGAFTVVSDDTINISGRSTGIFNDEIFRFLFNDKSEQNLMPDNKEPWLSIIKWNKPSQTEKLVSYNFKVVYNEGGDALNLIPAGETEISLTQFAYWNFNPSLNVFGQLVNESSERLRTVKENTP